MARCVDALGKRTSRRPISPVAFCVLEAEGGEGAGGFGGEGVVGARGCGVEGEEVGGGEGLEGCEGDGGGEVGGRGEGFVVEFWEGGRGG